MMPKHILKASQRGQSLVELAISLTVMLMLLAGAVTFGMALFSYVALRDAAQEGALYGSFNPNDPSDPSLHTVYRGTNTSGILGRVRAASTSPINLSDPGVVPDEFIVIETTTKDASSNDLACEGSGTDKLTGAANTPNGIRVTVGYDYPIIMPYVGAIIGQHIHLRATVVDTILEPKCN